MQAIKFSLGTEHNAPLRLIRIERKIISDNCERIWYFGVLSLSICLPLLILDNLRWKVGLFEENQLFLWLFITHMSTGFSAIAAIVLFWKNDHIKKLETAKQRWLLFTYLSLFYVPYIVMGILSFVVHGSTILFCLMLIVLNLGFTIHTKPRILFNLLFLLLFAGTILSQQGTDVKIVLVKIIECLGCTLTTFLIGELQYHRTIKKFHYEILFQEQMEEMNAEKERNNHLLLNLLPKNAVLELKKNGFIQARTYEHAAVGILALTNFNELNNKLSPVRLIRSLNNYYSEFDRIVSEFGLERIKAQGHTYLFTAGLTEGQEASIPNMLNAAGLMIKFIQAELDKTEAVAAPFTGKIGIHSGPLGAGVVGNGRFSYEIWGDTLTTAEQIKDLAQDKEILISETTRNQLLNCRVCTLHGTIESVSGKKMNVYHFGY